MLEILKESVTYWDSVRILCRVFLRIPLQNFLKDCPPDCLNDFLKEILPRPRSDEGGGSCPETSSLTTPCPATLVGLHFTKAGGGAEVEVQNGSQKGGLPGSRHFGEKMDLKKEASLVAATSTSAAASNSNPSLTSASNS